MSEFALGVHALLGLLSLAAVVLGGLQLAIARALGGPVLLLVAIVLIGGTGVALDSVLQIRVLLGLAGPVPETDPQSLLPRLFGIAAAGAMVAMFLHGGLERERDRRDRAERELQENQARAQDFAAASGQWFWETDAEHRYTWISERFEDHVEGRREWLYGQMRTEVGRPVDPDPEWERHLEDIAARRPFRDVTFHRVGIGGRSTWIRSSGVPFYDADGRFRGYRGSGSDITEMVLAQRAMEQARRHLRQAFDHMVDGLALFDAQGRLVLANEGYTDFPLAPGTSYDEVIERAFNETLPPELDEAARREWKARRLALHVTPGRTMEFEIVGRRWLRVTEQRFPDGSIAVLRTDITELKQRQFRLEQERQRAEEANRAKTEFLTNMSHELRTPLNAIIGFAEVMQDGLFGELPERYVGYAANIRESGLHLLELIGDLLDISKIEAGRFELDEQEIALDELLTESITAVMPQCEAKGHRFTRETETGDATLWADRRAVKQIVINLLSNAIKFTPDGGAVTLACDIRGEALELSVSDTGVGIPPEDRERVFEPFTQSGNALTRAEGGTGIGLPLSRALAEIHGGRLVLEDRPGGGTRALLVLPGRVRPLRDSA